MIKLKEILLIFISFLISFFIAELVYRLFSDQNSSLHMHRTMLFESGKNFKNLNNFFTYYPNQQIRSVGVYSSKAPSSLNDIIFEYDHKIETNNFGLVMKKNVIQNSKVVMVIGDSFTEGQGAVPWFYELEKEYQSGPTQLLNLGILGTGPQQWLLLSEYIISSGNLDVESIILNIIPGDISRSPWSFTSREIECLHLVKCNYAFGFQGFNFNTNQNYEDISRELITHINRYSKLSKFEKFKLLLLKSYVIKSIHKVYKKIKDKFKKRNDTPTFENIKNFKAILDLKNIALNKISVNILSTKNINSKNYKKSEEAIFLLNFLKEKEIKHSWCDIPIHGYHKIDGHPNQEGYSYILECTKEALR